MRKSAAPKVARAAIKEANSLWLGKNSVAMALA